MKPTFENYPCRSRIRYEDDIVVVIDTSTDKELYRGYEDYEPMKREMWLWDEDQCCYRLGQFLVKICLEVR